jgi:hypothetical protein
MECSMNPGPSDQDLELLSQYLDGELAAPASRFLEQRLRDEPDLGATLVRLEELNHRLRDALSERDAVPQAVEELLRTQRSAVGESEIAGAQVLNFPGAVAPEARAQRSRWPLALAASFVGAIAVALVVRQDILSPASGLPASALPGNDALVSTALDSTLSGGDWLELGDGRELRAVLTFPHDEGHWCREYLLRGGEGDWRAVACREGDRWVTKAAGLESYLEVTEGYRPAGSGDAEPVAVFITQHAAGIALGGDQERALIAGNWQ